MSAAGLDRETIEEWKARVAVERSRTAPPAGFPELPDIPGARYRDDAFFALECEAFYKHTWLYAAHADELPHSGSFKSSDRGGTPILLLRGTDASKRYAPSGGSSRRG